MEKLCNTCHDGPNRIVQLLIRSIMTSADSSYLSIQPCIQLFRLALEWWANPIPTLDVSS
ncbi:hypothetical protein OUZ56_010973 [Daphnia magna]|uniref:Uncharacterized protein n=1 Tax=Daphnia magna TaxID=35525 RepID=A0ABQ9YYX0_9CRUS|nr:hypothetical protein OUZ56_010973 [Daphnia magna]